MPYTIAEHGDSEERKYWAAFASVEFPSYETFWQRRIVATTCRPAAITFKSDAELTAEGLGGEDLTIAQLHYTCLLHLGRVHELYNAAGWDRDKLTEAMSRLVSATDVADELLQRNAHPGRYAPWSEEDGRDARRDWRRQDQTLKPLRDYRNRLVHGRIPPEVVVTYSAVRPTIMKYPTFAAVDRYLDWRPAFSLDPAEIQGDFTLPAYLVRDAWRDVLAYLEDRWQRHLLA